jgi:hypothetical protein
MYDAGDMLRSRSSVHCMSKKWWKGIFYYEHDEGNIATYRCWNSLVCPQKQVTMRQALEQLYYGLTGNTTTLMTSEPVEVRPTILHPRPLTNVPPKKRKQYNPNVVNPARFIGTDHLPLRQRKSLDCVRYYANPSVTKRVRSNIYCKSCNYTLCLDCFVLFHTPPN